MSNPLIRKLTYLNELTPDDIRLLTEALGPIREVASGVDIVSEGDRPPSCVVLMEGIVCRYKQLHDGRRQIVSFQVPGDLIDAHSFVLERVDHSMAALGACRIASISHDFMETVLNDHPRIALAIWRDTMIDAAVFREWVVNVGQRSAYERIAHVFCEVAYRLRLVGAMHGDRFRFPITQIDLGQAVGLSAVHVNRVMQRLKADGLVTHRGGLLTIQNWEGLKTAGNFDASYLYLTAGLNRSSPPHADLDDRG